MTKLTPFRIAIPDTDLEDLNRRLAATRWPEELPSVGWTYGIPTGYVRELAEYWRTGFDWRAQEAAWNRYPQFVTDIDGQRMHFLHIRSAEPGAVPLVLVHGWPFEDFTAMIDALTDPVAHGGAPDDAFHLVIPTLPGFGFSGPTHAAGAASTERSAELIAKLMAELGYERYGAQGGDAGSFIAPQLGRIDTEHVAGVHLNDPITIPSWGDDGSGYSANDQEKLAQMKDWSSKETSGYAGMHATRPQTLAPAVADSPAGMLAWVLDVVNTFKNPAKATPTDAIDRDMLLTNLSILWVHQHRRLVHAVVQRIPEVGRGAPRFRCAHRHRGLPRQQHDPRHRREAEHRGALVGVRPRRPLRADGSPRPHDRRPTRILPQTPLIQESGTMAAGEGVRPPGHLALLGPAGRSAPSGAARRVNGDRRHADRPDLRAGQATTAGLPTSTERRFNVRTIIMAGQ